MFEKEIEKYNVDQSQISKEIRLLIREVVREVEALGFIEINCINCDDYKAHKIVYIALSKDNFSGHIYLMEEYDSKGHVPNKIRASFFLKTEDGLNWNQKHIRRYLYCMGLSLDPKDVIERRKMNEH